MRAGARTARRKHSPTIRPAGERSSLRPGHRKRTRSKKITPSMITAGGSVRSRLTSSIIYEGTRAVIATQAGKEAVERHSQCGSPSRSQATRVESRVRPPRLRAWSPRRSPRDPPPSPPPGSKPEPADQRTKELMVATTNRGRNRIHFSLCLRETCRCAPREDQHAGPTLLNSLILSGLQR